MSDPHEREPETFPNLGTNPEELEPHLAAALEVVDEALLLAVARADERLERGRDLVLDRVQAEIRESDLKQGRRLRRRHLRAVFYATLLVCLALIVAAYIGTAAAIRLKRRKAQEVATEAELRVLSRALQRYAADHGELPGDAEALWQALATPQPNDGAHPYMVLNPHRFDGTLYRDDYGRSYRYRLEEGWAVVHSLGANGKDEGGLGDDLQVRVVLP